MTINSNLKYTRTGNKQDDGDYIPQTIPTLDFFCSFDILCKTLSRCNKTKMVIWNYKAADV